MSEKISEVVSEQVKVTVFVLRLLHCRTTSSSDDDERTS